MNNRQVKILNLDALAGEGINMSTTVVNVAVDFFYFNIFNY